MAKVVTDEGVGIGWKPERSNHKDYIFSDRTPMKKVSSLPRSALWCDGDSPVRNQMSEGSCVGHGWAAAADQIQRQDNDRFNTIYSARMGYNMARIVETERDKNDAIKFDNGAYVRDGGMAIRKYGICPESKWIYKEGDFAKLPTTSRLSAAERFRLEIQRCTDVDSVLNALALFRPIVAGFMCHTGMWNKEVDRTGMLPMPSDKDSEDGGHCTKWCGYNLDIKLSGFEGVIIFKNSWSIKWAWNPIIPGVPAGFGAFPIEFIRRGWADDMWAGLKEAA